MKSNRKLSYIIKADLVCFYHDIFLLSVIFNFLNFDSYSLQKMIISFQLLDHDNNIVMYVFNW